MYKPHLIIALIVLPCLLPHVSTAQEAAPAHFELAGEKIVWVMGNETVGTPLPAEGLALFHDAGRLYVALGELGVAVFEVTEEGALKGPRVIPVSHGRVTGFVELEGELWMRVDSTTAVKLKGAEVPGTQVVPFVAPPPGSGTAPSSTAPPPKKADAPERSIVPIDIVGVYPGKVRLGAGSNQGLEVGDLLAVYRSEQVAQLGEEAFEGRVQVATVMVEAVSDSSAIALIWRGDRLSRGDSVLPLKNKDKPSKIYPRHLTNIGEAEVVFRPIIKVGGDQGFGALCDVTVAWWGKHYFVDLRMQPLGFGWVDDGKIVTNSLLAEAGYNSRAFAVGMGVGMASVNGDMDAMLEYSFASVSGADEGGETEAPPPWEQRTQHGFALSQTVRLGAKDGLHLSINNLLVYHEDNFDYYGEEPQSGFIYAGTTGKLTIPIALRTSWFMEGGGGLMGYGFGATGVSTWLRGNGDAGSIGLSVSAGFAGLWGVRRREYDSGMVEDERIVVTGPMFSLGATYRFGKAPK